MRNLSVIGRIFFGIFIAIMGFQTIYYSDFPYMLIPPLPKGIAGHAIIYYVSGALLILAGASIIFEIKIRQVSFLLGVVFLVIFCFYFIPYQFMASQRYMHFGAWENSMKELALAGGAFLLAGRPRLGAILYAIPIISFGILHFLVAKSAADYVPSWIPYRIFWVYLAGIGLLASGIAILLNIIPRLAATLLGSMILIWFIILHMPRLVVAPAADMRYEITSTFLALAYCGIAFVIVGRWKKA
jgi:uncharacterized membrane protein